MATRQASGESVLTAVLALASLGLVFTSYRWTFIGGEKKWVVRAIWLLMLVLFSWITFIRVDVAQQIVVLIILLGLWMLVDTVR